MAKHLGFHRADFSYHRDLCTYRRAHLYCFSVTLALLIFI